MNRPFTAVVAAAFGSGLALAAAAARADEPKPFEPAEIRAATTKLIAALENPDPTAWVYMYTEDAGFLEAGSKPLEGRAKLLELAKAMQPMSAVVITPSRIEGHGNLAYLYGTGSWTDGRPPQKVTTNHAHLVLVWRKEADGEWRVAQEALVPDVP